MGMLSQTNRAVTHSIAAVGNITESIDIWSQVLVLQATLAKEEAVFDLELQRNVFVQRKLDAAKQLPPATE